MSNDGEILSKGKKASLKKGKKMEIEAGHKANKRHKFFTEFKKIAESLKNEETSYQKIKKYFEKNVKWDWGSGEDYLRPQVYDATVNDNLRTSRWKKTPEPQFNIFFAMEGERDRLVAYDQKKHGNWRLSKVNGQLVVMQNENDPVKFKIAGIPYKIQPSPKFGFEQVMENLKAHRTKIQANYLPVAIRLLLRFEPVDVSWNVLETEIKMMNSFYPETKTGREYTAREMIVEQQGRKNYVGIVCKGPDGKKTSTVSEVVSFAIDSKTWTNEEKDEIDAFCARTIAMWHVKEMRKN